MRRNKKWSLEEDQLLLELKEAQMPLAAIAEKLNRTQAAVDGRMNALRNQAEFRVRESD
jgi:biotin operon repressor